MYFEYRIFNFGFKLFQFDFLLLWSEAISRCACPTRSCAIVELHPQQYHGK